MQKEFMVGVTGNQFAPQMKMSRAMFVTAIGRLDNIKSSAAADATKFTDVAQNAWYANSVDWAVKNGIVLGVSDTEFNPDGDITREQMCLIMERFVKYWNDKRGSMIKPDVKEVMFQDAASISSYAREAVFACQNWGLVIGDENQNFRPQDASTRAEAAAVLSRLSALLKRESSSGSSSDDGETTVTRNETYLVKVKLSVTDSISTTDPELLAGEYPVSMKLRSGEIVAGSIVGDKALAEIAGDLVSGENAAVIRTAIQTALNKAQGTRTISFEGNQAKITVAENKISMKVNVPADKLLKSEDASVVRFALVIDTSDVTQADIEALLEKLQNSDEGQMDITGTDLAAMEKLIQKAEELQGKTSEEVQQIVDNYVAEKPELEKVISGMTAENIQEAARDYQEQLEAVKETVLETAEINEETGEVVIPDGGVSVSRPAAPVAMWVTLDLGSYYDEAMALYENIEKKDEYMDKVASQLQERLGLQWNSGLEVAVDALYALNDPARYVVKNDDGSVSMMDVEAYLALISENIEKVGAFYEALAASEYLPEDEVETKLVDEAFYQKLIDFAEAKNNGRVQYIIPDGTLPMHKNNKPRQNMHFLRRISSAGNALTSPTSQTELHL